MILVVAVIFVVTMVIAVIFAVLVVVMRQFAVVGRSIGNADARKNGAAEKQRNQWPNPLHVGTAGVVRNYSIGVVRIVGGGHALRVAKEVDLVALGTRHSTPVFWLRFRP